MADIAAGIVPWGKAPFPRPPVASYWVPTLGTKPIKIFPVHGKLKRYPLATTTSASTTVTKPTEVHKAAVKVVSVHTPSVKPKLVHKAI